MKRKLSIILALSLLLSFFSIPINAEAAIVINKKKATLEVDSILTLKIDGLKEGTETIWSTNKKTVATVGKTTGKVTAKAEGSATITATVGEKKYTCKVTVVDSNKPTDVPTVSPTIEPTPIPTIIPKPTSIPTITPEPTQIPNETDKYMQLAKDAYAELYSSLKLPSSLIIYQIYAGSVYNGPKMDDSVVVMYDCSAMNSFGGYTRTYFMAWYNKFGTISYDDKNYKPSEIKDRIILDVNEVIQ